jgi:transposase-like protein
MNEKLCCPRCSSDQITKAGKHYDLKGTVQRHKCKVCGTSFSNDGYFHGRYALALLQYASVLYQNGRSCEKIAHKITEEFHQKVSGPTIWRWINKLEVKPRAKNSGDQKNKVVRDLIEVGIITTVRFASSEVPEKFLLLDNIVVKEAEVGG